MGQATRARTGPQVVVQASLDVNNVARGVGTDDRLEAMLGKDIQVRRPASLENPRLGCPAHGIKPYNMRRLLNLCAIGNKLLSVALRVQARQRGSHATRLEHGWACAGKGAV